MFAQRGKLHKKEKYANVPFLFTGDAVPEPFLMDAFTFVTYLKETVEGNDFFRTSAVPISSLKPLLF
jgi:hypothetical protein